MYYVERIKKDIGMCLIKTHDEPRIAQDDIEVWKVLTYEGLSPYQDYPYHHGINKPAEHSVIPVIPPTQEEINGGYLHAYRSKVKAEFCASRCNYILGCILTPEYVIQRMLIPKGTAYYEGNDGDICAECLYWPEEKTVGLFKKKLLAARV